MHQLTDIRPTGKWPAQNFTGDVYVTPIPTDTEPSRLNVALVWFTPARTPTGTPTRLARPCMSSSGSDWSAPAMLQNCASAPDRPSSARQARNTGMAPPPTPS